MRSHLRISAAVAATCLTATGLTLLGGTAHAAGRSTVPGSQPSWANAKALKSNAPTSDTVHLRVYLPWRNQADLAKVAHDVSTPGSASYLKFLTPAQFRSAYAPTAGSVNAVRNWLKGAGFSIADVPDNGHYVAVEGTVAQAQSAFGTTLGLYSAYGRTLRAPETAPSVPTDVAPYVSGIVGLDDSPLLQSPDSTQGNGPAKQDHGAPGAGFRVGTPCSTYYGQKTVTTGFTAYGTTTKPLAVCATTPMQVRGLYGLTDSDSGAGQTVAFVGATASPTLVQDVTQYSRLHGLPDPQISQIVAPGVYRHPTTPQQTPGDFYGEETLDAESIHTTAPQAKLLFVGSSNAYQDFDVSINHIVDRRLAPIISISYGFTGEAVPQGFVNSLNSTFLQAVATGIGIYVSSGDDGDDAIDFDGKTAVDFYANSPNVTAVGGTSVAVVPGTATGAGFTTSGAPKALDARAHGEPYGIDDPANAVNRPGWARLFEVGWQTASDPITGGAISGSGSSYTLTGSPSAPVPGAVTSGGGGGVSRVFPQPSYQKGVTDAAADGATGFTGGRAVPDISALADPNTGFLVGQTQTFSDGTYYDEYRLGGTSAAAPLMAGIAAVLNQRHGSPLGFLNPRIYGAYKSAPGAYYDVDQRDLFGSTTSDPLPAVVRVNYKDSESAAGGLTYFLRTQEAPNQTLHSVRGYDTATGVGTPNGQSFLAALS